MYKLTSYKLAILVVLNVLSLSTASADNERCDDNTYHERTIYNYSTQTWFITGRGVGVLGLGSTSVRFNPCNEKTSFGCAIPAKGQINISYAGNGGLVPRPPAGYITITDTNGTAQEFFFGCNKQDIYIFGSADSTVMLLNRPRNGDIMIINIK
ncbi:hypothetical protein Lnau_1413 [Legionella nautarum]|uniref:Secreted protein n=1 Tax=Legionella nautarum TaxID=45070 RepID=A0A0W0WVT1_9GAMM|nr:hypothetical protein [Legionella nautarum]KTD36429.1 hypothetical protein Lnau_1413 [Legionella nautarum]